MLIIQALSQLRAKYGPDVAEIIRSNCNLQVFLATNDNETAEYFSKICGEKTIKDVNVTLNQKGEQTESYSLGARALITPSELLTLPEGVSIAKLLRTQPAKVKQTAFWKSKAYYKGEQIIETKWNPNLFVFDKDGFYDIVNRNKSEVDYVLNDITQYDVKNIIDESMDEEINLDSEETDTTLDGFNSSTTSGSSKTVNSNDEDLFSSLFNDDVKTEEDITTESTVESKENQTEEEDFSFDGLDFNFDDILKGDLKDEEQYTVSDNPLPTIDDSKSLNDIFIDLIDDRSSK